MLCGCVAVSARAEEARPPASEAQLARWVQELGGRDAVAEHNASQGLVEAGQAAVGALADLAANGQSLSARLIAVELLGRIGTAAANDAMLELLRNEKDLAVRGQICMQLGYARERRAIPVIAQWLRTIGPNGLDDVGGPKEAQPSTCYIRHIEALGLIGEEEAIPILDEFAGRIPAGIGFGGFITTFVRGGVKEAIEEIREQAAFWKAVRKEPGLEQKIAPVFTYVRRERLARFRLHEDEIVRQTDTGKQIVGRLTTHQDAAVSGAAKQLLSRWDSLAK